MCACLRIHANSENQHEEQNQISMIGGLSGQEGPVYCQFMHLVLIHDLLESGVLPPQSYDTYKQEGCAQEKLHSQFSLHRLFAIHAEGA